MRDHQKRETFPSTYQEAVCQPNGIPASSDHPTASLESPQAAHWFGCGDNCFWHTTQVQDLCLWFRFIHSFPSAALSFINASKPTGSQHIFFSCRQNTRVEKTRQFLSVFLLLIHLPLIFKATPIRSRFPMIMWCSWRGFLFDGNGMTVEISWAVDGTRSVVDETFKNPSNPSGYSECLVKRHNRVHRAPKGHQSLGCSK